MKSAIVCYYCGKLRRLSESYQIKVRDYKRLEPDSAVFVTLPPNATETQIEEAKRKIAQVPTITKVRICRMCAKAAGYKKVKRKPKKV
jgi:cell division protein FtsX